MHSAPSLITNDRGCQPISPAATHLPDINGRIREAGMDEACKHHVAYSGEESQRQHFGRLMVWGRRRRLLLYRPQSVKCRALAADRSPGHSPSYRTRLRAD